jgi:hypothetical protein
LSFPKVVKLRTLPSLVVRLFAELSQEAARTLVY